MGTKDLNNHVRDFQEFEMRSFVVDNCNRLPSASGLSQAANWNLGHCARCHVGGYLTEREKSSSLILIFFLVAMIEYPA